MPTCVLLLGREERGSGWPAASRDRPAGRDVPSFRRQVSPGDSPIHCRTSPTRSRIHLPAHAQGQVIECPRRSRPDRGSRRPRERDPDCGTRLHPGRVVFESGLSWLGVAAVVGTESIGDGRYFDEEDTAQGIVAALVGIFKIGPVPVMGIFLTVNASPPIGAVNSMAEKSTWLYMNMSSNRSLHRPGE